MPTYHFIHKNDEKTAPSPAPKAGIVHLNLKAEAAFFMSFAKQKSWSVKLLQGYVEKGKVRIKRCGDCNSTAHLVAENLGKPELLLFGCHSLKCKGLLLRLNLKSVELGVFQQETQQEVYPAARPTIVQSYSN